ncbi:MAG TPA: SusC/RagA family TonB-linked outer membrane protein [Gemmatimonadaceae bacterium]|jgi:TonB-linked SusC/RagA family outer membrane protein
MGRSLALLVVAPFIAAVAQAQTGRIAGAVTGTDGQPLQGTNVVVVGTSIASSAGADGRYTLPNVPVGRQLVRATHVGYAPDSQYVSVGANQSATASFRLATHAVQLEGVVTVGYGTENRREVTGAVSSITADALNQVVGGNPLDAIKGRIPGVDITATSFDPGAAQTIRIRGVRSITANNNPLYVVDGVPITGDLRDIDAGSIEAIDVLKDASATAVYGSRGANGVVMITTKRGAITNGGTDFTLSSTYGVSKIRQEVDMMSGTEFANYRRESYRNSTNATYAAACANYMTNPTPCDAVALDPTMRANLAAGVNTNWQDLMLRQGNLQNTNIGFSGGNVNTRFRAGFAYLGQNSINIVQGYNDRSGSFNISQTNGKLDLQLGIQGSKTHRDIGRGSVMWDEALFNPALGRNVDSTGRQVFLPTEDGLLVNPVMAAYGYQRAVDRTNVLGTLTGSYELMPGLRIHSNFGPQYNNQVDGALIGIYTRQKRGTGAPDATARRNQNTNYTLSNFLDFDRTYGEHHVEATALYEVASFETVFDSAAATQLPFDNQLWYNLGTGATPTLSGQYTKTALQSGMGRARYTFLDRYTLEVVGRYDGSSVLAEGHKFAFFPAASLGWQIGDESFMQKVPAISDLKLRLSYGRSGNSAIGAYQTLGLLNRTWYASGTSYLTAFAPGAIPNPSLKWETTDKFNAGLDFGIFNQRIAGSLDVYRDNTSNLLLSRALPFTSGYASVLENVGATKNTGVELGVTTQNLQNFHGLAWTSDFSWSTNKNRIVALSSGLTSDVGNLRFVGQPINVYYDYKYVGLWQTADSALARTSCGCKVGSVRVADINGDGKLNADDRTIIGRHYNFPRWQGSMNNRFNYKSFDISALTTARIGFTINDAFTAAYDGLSGRFNNVATNYWTPENQSGTDPRPSVDGLGTFTSARNYKDGSFVRIRDITLGYTVSPALASRLSSKGMRLYARVQDPFIFTDYKGWDPEAGFSVGDPNNNGSQVDQGGPAFRSILFGIDFHF